MNVYDLLSPSTPEPHSGYVWFAHLPATARAGRIDSHFSERLFEKGSIAAPKPAGSIHGLADVMRHGGVPRGYDRSQTASMK